MSREFIRTATLVVALAIALPAGAYAQGRDRNPNPPPQGGDQMNRVLDDIRSVIQDAERRRDPDRDLIQDLRRIVRRYDTPWRVTTLQDDFRDGELRRNPAWDTFGNVIVDRQYGMRLQQQVRRQGDQRGGDLGNRLLGAVLEEALRPRQQGGPVDQAEAYSRAPISSAFSVTLQVNSRSRDGGRVEFVVYQGSDRLDGYRLAYSPNAQNTLELLRVNGRRASVVEAARQRVDLEDGRDHRIVWTRDRDGDFRVEVDGREVIEASDRGNDNFDGFGVINYGGDFGLKSVQIAGADRDRR